MTGRRLRSILVIAGESSGEAHAAGLVRSLRSLLPDSAVRFWGSGGRQMSGEGVELLLDVSQLAAIGPLAATRNLASYWKLFRAVLRKTAEERPDLAILVDFAEFNLRLAGRLKRLGVPVCYFVAPQVWAWRRSRVKLIRRHVDLMLVIFPFEKEFFERHGIPCCYVGNPTAGRILRSASPEVRGEGTPTVALLPGSRDGEVSAILPILLDACRYVKERLEVRVRLLGAPSVSRLKLQGVLDTWRSESGTDLEVEVCDGPSETFLRGADCAIVKSGTSTLEAMLVGVPFAMVYRLPLASWLLLRPLVPAQAFCLANLVAGRQIVPEFVQWNATGERVGEFVVGVLKDPQKGEELKRALKEAAGRLGPGDAYAEAARRVVGLINQ